MVDPKKAKTHCAKCRGLLNRIGRKPIQGEAVRHCENPACDWCKSCVAKLYRKIREG